jgi:hypothetical protein
MNHFYLFFPHGTSKTMSAKRVFVISPIKTIVVLLALYWQLWLPYSLFDSDSEIYYLLGLQDFRGPVGWMGP